MSKRLRGSLLVLLLALVACSSIAGAKKPIVMWMSSQPTAVHEWAKGFEAAFNAANPDIELTIEQYPLIDSQRQKLVVAIAGGVAPDIVYDSDNLMAQWVNTNVALPIDKYFNQWSEKSDIMPDLLNWLRFDGQLWGMPFSVWSIGDLYNLDVFAGAGMSLPKSWDEMVDTAKRIRRLDGDGTVKVIGYNMLVNNLGSFVEQQFAMEQLGSTIIDIGARTANLGTEAARKALTYLRDVATAGFPGTIAGVGSIDRILRGEMAVYHSYFGYNLLSLAETIKSSGINLAYRRIVGPQAGKDAIQGNGGMLFVTRTSKYPDEAWRVIEAFMERSNLRGYLLAHGTALPSRMSLHTDRDLRARPWATELMSVLYSPLYTYSSRHFYSTDFRVQAGNEFRQAIMGLKSIEEALEQAQQIIDTTVAAKMGLAKR